MSVGVGVGVGAGPGRNTSHVDVLGSFSKTKIDALSKLYAKCVARTLYIIGVEDCSFSILWMFYFVCFVL